MSYIHWPRLYNVILPKIFEVLKKYKEALFFISKVGDYTVIIMILLIVIIDEDITQLDYHL